MTAAIVKKLLHGSITTLERDGDGPDSAEAVRRLFALEDG